jgi:hypothetical protein
MRYLITYSNNYEARKQGLPPEGSMVYLKTAEDFQALVKRVGDEVILHEEGYRPSWTELYDLHTDEELEDCHRIRLPEEWESMPWIEVYNGYRE